MKSLKSRGGLTHGSGMTESVRLTWVRSMHKCASIHEAMSSLTGMNKQTSADHVDLGKARAHRDGQDFKKFLQWFDIHDPFKQGRHLICLSSGVTTGDNDGINCDSAEDIGTRIHSTNTHDEEKQHQHHTVQNQIKYATDKNAFLANSVNKSQFIKLLSQHLA